MSEHAEPIVQLLSVLLAEEVEFIVVGGAAAVLNGDSIVTRELDIVHKRTEANVAKLARVLKRLGAYYRPDPGKRRLKVQTEHMMGSSHLNLRPQKGDLDVLCELIGSRSYEDLLPFSIKLQDGEVRFCVLALPMVIQIKAEVGRPKGRLVLPILLSALEQREG